MKRGEVRWASLPDSVGSGPWLRRPVLIVQSNAFNDSRIATVVVAVITSNIALADAPGNVRVGKSESGLPEKICRERCPNHHVRQCASHKARQIVAWHSFAASRGRIALGIVVVTSSGRYNDNPPSTGMLVPLM